MEKSNPGFLFLQRFKTFDCWYLNTYKSGKSQSNGIGRDLLIFSNFFIADNRFGVKQATAK
ncbi:hypothetical protein [Dyadobacter koreensis]|uniref:hypothetical protein n=1 Tax=Dyadobacter koreensis TaxID=408657 RepID=UPI000B85ECBF|nr:hypothetical protein [Dyadobacter koreensis]